jgi:transcriptional regulator with GAF, ATPase, and Fis domain
VLTQHAWPGNLRELRHEMQRASVLIGNRSHIEAGDLSLAPPTTAAQPNTGASEVTRYPPKTPADTHERIHWHGRACKELRARNVGASGRQAKSFMAIAERILGTAPMSVATTGRPP